MAGSGIFCVFVVAAVLQGSASKKICDKICGKVEKLPPSVTPFEKKMEANKKTCSSKLHSLTNTRRVIVYINTPSFDLNAYSLLSDS